MHPAFAAGFNKLLLTDESALFEKILEEAAKMPVGQQWDFVLQQYGDEVAELEQLTHAGNAIDARLKSARFKPRIRLVLFVETMSRAYEGKVKASLSVDDACLLNCLVPWRKPTSSLRFQARTLTS